MTGRIPTTITQLLATALYTQMINACPLTAGECREECYAYLVAKNTTSDVPLNVEAALSDFLNHPDQFNRKIGTDYEEDSIPGISEACYSESNAEVGCKEFLEVKGTNCTGSWKYECDYDKNRLPLYIWRASCNTTTSETIYYPVPVLKRNDSCNPFSSWQLVMEKVPVWCSCKQ